MRLATQCAPRAVTGVTVIPLNGFNESARRPGNAPCRGLQRGHQRLQPHFLERNHDAERGDRALAAVEDGHGNAPGVRIHHPLQLGETLVGCFGQQRADIVAGEPPVGIGELGKVAGLERLLPVRHQRQSGGGDVDGHPACHLRPVGHRAPPREPLNEQRIPPVQHRQVHVLVEDVLDVLHERHGRLPQRQGRGGTVYQLPEPESRADHAAGVSLEQPVAGELAHQPVRGGQRQPGPCGQVGKLQGADVLRKGGDQPDYPVHHRITRL